MRANQINFSYLNLHTVFEAVGTKNCDNNPALTASRPCFHDVYPGFKQNIREHMRIAIYRKADISQARRWNNYCPFTLKQVKEHINYMKKFMNFECSITVEPERFIINLDIRNKGIYLRLFLTWLRYLYEFPNNVALMDMLKLKKMEEFKDISPILLHSYILNIIRPGYYDDQAIPNGHRVAKNMKDEDIVERIKHLLVERYVRHKTNDILSYRNDSSMIIRSIQEKNREITKRNPYGRESWLTTRTLKGWNEEFETRLEMYKQYLKYFKDEKE